MSDVRPGLLGTFVLGSGNSFLGEEERIIMEPYPILHVKPALAEKAADSKITVVTTFDVERVDGFSGALTYSVDAATIPAGFTAFKFTGLSAVPERVEVEFAVDSSAAYQGARIRLRAARGGVQVAEADLYVQVALPNAFCVINGLTIPVTEPSLQPALEVLGDAARAYDGTRQSSVRGFKRSWLFGLEFMPHQEYAAFARHLFTNLNTPKVMSGGIAPDEAVLVYLTPKEPRLLKAGGTVLYGLQGQIDER